MNIAKVLNDIDFKAFGEYIDYIRGNVNLPKDDSFMIAWECFNKGMTKEEALQEAKSLIS